MGEQAVNHTFNTFMLFMVQYLIFYHEGLEEQEEIKKWQAIIWEIVR